MSPDDALHQITELMMLVMILSMPPILVASVVGIVISLLQALTQFRSRPCHSRSSWWRWR